MNERAGAGLPDTVSKAAYEIQFNPDWYIEQHTEVASLIERGWFVDALHHYLIAGCREGKSPNPDFQEDYYCSVYPDIAKAIEEKTINCGFDHYVKYGQAEGRRFRPATRGALVDLSSYDPASAIHERLLIELGAILAKFGEWDFWLLTREASHDVLSYLDSVNVSRICLDRIIGDVSDRWKGLPVEVFVSPFGPSDHYGPAYRTITILPELPSQESLTSGRRVAELERALGISEVIICLNLADRSTLLNRWYVERERVRVLHLPPSSRIAGKARLDMALLQMGGRRFMVTDLTAEGVSEEVALAALVDGCRASDGAYLVALVSSDGVSRLTARAGELGITEDLILVDQPTPQLWRWLLENCSALLDTSRDRVAPGLLEDALAFRRPLVCSRLTKSLIAIGDYTLGFDVDRIATVGTACRTAFEDLAAASELTANLIEKSFTGLSSGEIPSPLQTFFDRLAGSSRSSGTTRELLLGVREGNRVHGSFWFAMPPSAAARSLLLEISVPQGFPEPSVDVVASMVGQPEVRQTIERGRSERLTISLPPTRIAGRVVAYAKRADGSLVKVQPDWLGLELRAATVLASGIDLLQSCTDVFGTEARNEPTQDTEQVVGLINAKLDEVALPLTGLETTVGGALKAKPALRLTFPGMPSVLRAVAPVALHLTRRQFVQEEMKFHGSNKDQSARQQYLRDRGFSIITEPIYDWKYDALIERLDAERHADPHVIILEAMLNHPLMRYLRERFPKAKILARSHNAEVPHRLDTHTAALLMEKGSRLAWLNPREALTRGRNVFDHWRYDAGAFKLVDHILSISQWETERYWPKFGPSEKVSTVPYFLPRDLIYDGALSPSKEKRCVCLTSASPGPVIYDALRNFVRLVDGIDDPGGWDFTVTGDLDARYSKRSSRCSFVGRVENPIALMSGATSMALLSKFGYGFKTKILDAVSARSYTLMPQSLMDRHPVEVHQYCFAVDMTSPASFKDALERSLEPFPEGDPNELLRRKAYNAMDAILGLT